MYDHLIQRFSSPLDKLKVLAYKVHTNKCIHFSIQPATIKNNFHYQVPVSQLLGDGSMAAVRFWHDQLFAKPAKHGGCVAW